MTGQADGPTWHRPIPGDVRPIYDEVERLNALKEALWAAADELKRRSIKWSGSSYDRFLETRAALANQYRAAGDLHYDAAEALAQYHVELTDLRRYADELARQADHGADSVHAPTAWGDIQRLWHQLQQQGDKAALVIRECATALASLHAVTGENVVEYVLPPQTIIAAAPTPPPEPAPAPTLLPAALAEPLGALQLDPSLATTDPTKLERNVQVLAAEILIGTHHVVPL